MNVPIVMILCIECSYSNETLCWMFTMAVKLCAECSYGDETLCWLFLWWGNFCWMFPWQWKFVWLYNRSLMFLWWWNFEGNAPIVMKLCTESSHDDDSSLMLQWKCMLYISKMFIHIFTVTEWNFETGDLFGSFPQ